MAQAVAAAVQPAADQLDRIIRLTEQITDTDEDLMAELAELFAAAREREVRRAEGETVQVQQVILDAVVAKLLKSRFVPDAFAEAVAEVISLPSESLSACLTDPAAIVALCLVIDEDHDESDAARDASRKESSGGDDGGGMFGFFKGPLC